MPELLFLTTCDCTEAVVTIPGGNGKKRRKVKALSSTDTSGSDCGSFAGVSVATADLVALEALSTRSSTTSSSATACSSTPGGGGGLGLFFESARCQFLSGRDMVAAVDGVGGGSSGGGGGLGAATTCRKSSTFVVGGGGPYVALSTGGAAGGRSFDQRLHDVKLASSDQPC